MTEKELVGACFREARRAAGLTQMRLAVMVEITPQQLNRYENGRQMPGGSIIRRMAIALGVPTDVLLFADRAAEEAGDQPEAA